MRHWFEMRMLALAKWLVLSIVGGHHTSYVNAEAITAAESITQLERWLRK